jgi:hypothetical protein
MKVESELVQRRAALAEAKVVPLIEEDDMSINSDQT